MSKILIVDDSESQRSSLRRDLEASGFAVIEAKNGYEGLQQLAENSDIKLVISDVNMPDMDGVTMCQKLKDKGTHPGITIFMLTSEGTPELKLRSKAAGASAWIIKPYVADKIVSVVKKVMSK